jgi:hypothetical protein
MADAHGVRIVINGITLIDKHSEGTNGILHDDQIACEKLPEWDVFEGPALALIRAGIVEEHMLPGQPNRGKDLVVIEGRDGEKWATGYIEIVRKGERWFQVKVAIDPEEGGRRRQAEHRRLQAEEAAKKLAAAQEREALELAELPRTHRQYRESCLKTLRAHLNIVRDTAVAPNRFSGFCFNETALRAFDKAATELLKTLEHGGTLFDPAAQERRVIEIRSQSSRVNMPLQDFLQKVGVQMDGTEKSAD